MNYNNNKNSKCYGRKFLGAKFCEKKPEKESVKRTFGICKVDLEYFNIHALKSKYSFSLSLSLSARASHSQQANRLSYF